MRPPDPEEADYEPYRITLKEAHDDEEDVSLLSSHSTPRAQKRLHRTRNYRSRFHFAAGLAFLLALSTIVLLVHVVQLQRAASQRDAPQTAKKDVEPGFSTDFEDARKAVAYEQKEFTGKIMWNRTAKDVYYDLPPEQLRYFGDPAIYPEIDKNWRDVLRDEFITVTTKESMRLASPDFVRLAVDNQRHASVGVIHGLHCLNAIRQHLHKDYYLKHGGLHQDGPGYPPNFSHVHMEHCLNYVRQIIQCHGDLTPIPLYMQREMIINHEQIYIASGGTHMCRNFDNIRTWLKERRETIGAFSEFRSHKKEQMNDLFEMPEPTQRH